MNVLPFESQAEHEAYCSAVGASFEEGSIGFKIFDDNEKLGMLQIKFVGSAAYFLAVKAIEDKLTKEALANVCYNVVEFLTQLGVNSLVFPVQDDSDRFIAEILGFDRVSETLYVFDFVEEGGEETEECSCGDECHHKH